MAVSPLPQWFEGSEYTHKVAACIMKYGPISRITLAQILGLSQGAVSRITSDLIYAEKLIGAILVGTGLPQLGNEREILRSFYTENGENGFDYAYRYPGMNKVLQAAGRVIRTREDHGVILLLDERFRQREYSNLFPVEWNDRKTCTLSNVEAQLQKFWESIPDKISHKL